jgi:prophage maintenance system killer protein
MLKKYGGYLGFERGISLFDVVLAEVKASRGTIYRKAAIFLKRIVSVRIFQDGNHRTAYEVTDTFLRMNGGATKIIDKQKVIRFIKNIDQYNIEQVEDCLQNGKMP